MIAQPLSLSLSLSLNTIEQKTSHRLDAQSKAKQNQIESISFFVTQHKTRLQDGLLDVFDTAVSRPNRQRTAYSLLLSHGKILWGYGLGVQEARSCSSGLSF